MIKLGPILKFAGCEDSHWSVSVLVVCDQIDPAPLFNASPPALIDAPVCLKSWPITAPRFQVWRYTLRVPMGMAEQWVTYRLENKDYTFAVPSKDQVPTCAYGSCNGFSDPKAMKKVKDQNALWKTMAERNAARPYHLLFMGGDQVYSDSLWVRKKTLQDWAQQPEDQRRQAPFTPDMQAQVEDFYFNLYLERWAQPEVARMFACIPTVMMWDDHDIFDGWGSYQPALQHCPVYQGIYTVARESFRLFQLHAGATETPSGVLPNQSGFSQAYRAGPWALVVPDMRSERTQDQVLSEQTWQAIYGWMDQQTDCVHLYFMSSIPLVHPDFSTLEALLRVLPGKQELEDDLQDHWLSRAHRQERLRLIHRLLKWSADLNGRVTVLSGDVHVGAVGVIESDRAGALPNSNVINQLTASGIVHPAPAAMVLFYLEHVGDRIEQVDRGITASMYEFPGTQHRFIGARNFLSLEPDHVEQAGGTRIWANWCVEGETTPYTKVIHPVSQS